MDREWTCRRCGEVIGIYEPAVVVEGPLLRRTSRLLENGPARPAAERYHESCAAETEAAAASWTVD